MILLLLAVVGSGIAAQRLALHDIGIELLENAVATGAALVAIILAVGPVSGAHLNPLVSCVEALFGGLRHAELAAHVVAQLCGAAVAACLIRMLWPRIGAVAHDVVMPHDDAPLARP